MIWNQVIYANCMNKYNGLPTLKDKSIDLCLTDPPYNHDNYINWSISWFNELKRICNRVLFAYGWMHFDFWKNIKDVKFIKSSSRRYESLLYYGNFDGINLNNIRGCIVNCFHERDMIHLYTRDVKSYKYILSEIKPKSVLDPFLGSGTTAQACQELNIKWVGYELFDKYSQDINKRLSNTIL